MAVDPSTAVSALGLDPSRLTQAALGAQANGPANLGLDGAQIIGGPAQIGQAAPGGGPDGAFDGALKAIEQAEAKENAATSLEAAYARGEDVPLHQVMAAAEEASLALETLAALRNRVLDAVNELTRMQV